METPTSPPCFASGIYKKKRPHAGCHTDDAAGDPLKKLRAAYANFTQTTDPLTPMILPPKPVEPITTSLRGHLATSVSTTACKPSPVRISIAGLKRRPHEVIDSALEMLQNYEQDALCIDRVDERSGKGPLRPSGASLPAGSEATFMEDMFTSFAMEPSTIEETQLPIDATEVSPLLGSMSSSVAEVSHRVPSPLPIISLRPKRHLDVIPQDHSLEHPLSPRPPTMKANNTSNSIPTRSNLGIPTVTALTSFPFRITSANPAFYRLTGRQSRHLIGKSFFDLFVKETDYSPNMANFSTLKGVFCNDIVRVMTTSNRSAEEPSWKHVFDDAASSGTEEDISLGHHDDDDSEATPFQAGVFCQIHIDQESNTQTTGTCSTHYFCIQLSPLPFLGNPTASAATGNWNPPPPGIVHLPMPAKPRSSQW